MIEEPISKSELGNHLLGACDILRGPINAAVEQLDREGLAIGNADEFSDLLDRTEHYGKFSHGKSS